MSSPEKDNDESNFNIVLPIAFFLVMLFIPLSINTFMHYVSAERLRSIPLVMKLPVDNTAIVIPSEITQYERFKVSMKIDTVRLASIFNEISRTSTPGTNIQGVSGLISPEMKAEVSGENFIIDQQGPLEQLYLFDNETHWTWHLTPESSGRNMLKFYLHLLTYDDGKTTPIVVDVADLTFSVTPNPSVWVAKNWGWLAASFLLIIVGWKLIAGRLNRR